MMNVLFKWRFFEMNDIEEGRILRKTIPQTLQVSDFVSQVWGFHQQITSVHQFSSIA
jgi:hypothetical protein